MPVSNYQSTGTYRDPHLVTVFALQVMFSWQEMTWASLQTLFTSPASLVLSPCTLFLLKEELCKRTGGFPLPQYDVIFLMISLALWLASFSGSIKCFDHNKKLNSSGLHSAHAQESLVKAPATRPLIYRGTPRNPWEILQEQRDR